MSKRHYNGGVRKICGCPRRAWNDCRHPWHVNYKPRIGPLAGQSFRFSLDRELHAHVGSKADAIAAANKLRAAIDAGRFRQAAPVRDTLTIRQLLNTYDERHLALEHADTVANLRSQIAVITRTPIARPDGTELAFGAWRIDDVTTDTIERFLEARRRKVVITTIVRGKERRRFEGGKVAANRNHALVRAAFNWAIRRKLLTESPFKFGTETVVAQQKEHQRRRRLEGDEADRLLTACGPHLRALVEAALESGCRKGELLSLQWSQIRIVDGRSELFLPARKTKTKRDRRIPISRRLQLILDMRRNGPDGEPHAPTAYIFGNAIGQRVACIKTAWRLACRRTGITDLHFHDLRREAGSRWLAGGVPLHTVRDWLGHSDISQTSTYLESTFHGSHEAMQRFEERRSAPPAPADTQDGPSGAAERVTTH